MTRRSKIKEVKNQPQFYHLAITMLSSMFLVFFFFPVSVHIPQINQLY